MASSLDSFMREYNEASKLADDVNNMISVEGETSGPEIKSHTSEIRRKIIVLWNTLDGLELLLLKLPSEQPTTQKELHKCQDLLANLKSKAKKMTSVLYMSNFANREDLLGSSGKPSHEMDSTTLLDNNAIAGLQQQIMKEQDEALEKLGEAAASLKHIGLRVNEQLGLHTRLIDPLVDSEDSRLQVIQKKLAILDGRARRGCTPMSLLLAVIVITLILAVVALLLIKHLSWS